MSGTEQQATDAADAATVDQDYEAVLAAVNTIGKANSALEADVVTDADEEKTSRQAATEADDEDEDDEDEGDEDEDDEKDDDLAKAATQFMDASPLVGALVASHDRLAKGQRLLVREIRALRRDQGVMAKANSILLTQNRALRERVEEIGTGGAGRRSVLQRPMAKAREVVTTDNPNDVLFGPDLMAKATTAALNGDTLTALELSTLNEYVGMGATLGNVRESDPQLASRVDAALAAKS